MIQVNIDKAKNIAHNMRRAMRTREFAPLDVKATIPGEAEAAEQARQAVRGKYATMQEAIDGAETVEQLHSIVVPADKI